MQGKWLQLLTDLSCIHIGDLRPSDSGQKPVKIEAGKLRPG
jgi:hypothetical protein